MKKFYLLLLSSIGFTLSSAAQTLIDPNTGGGFDVGNTFAANGWTVVNSSKNKWVVGTTTYKSAPNSAYISRDSIASPGLYDYDYDYDNTTTHISHFYQKVVIPTNLASATLTFYLKGNVENDINGNLIDGPEVYADFGLVAPVADALPGGTAVQLFPVSTLNSSAGYISETINFTSLAGKTIFLIFTWVNDDDGIGNNPPSSIDAVNFKYCIKNTPDSVIGGGGFCHGNPGADVRLKGSVIGINYQLYFNGSPLGSPLPGTGAALDFGLQDVGTYTVIGTTGECSYTMPGSVVVFENPLPTPSAGSNSPICSGATLNLTAAGGSAYSWTGPNGFTAVIQNPSIINVTVAASGTYTTTVTDNNGCSATASTDVSVTPGAVGGTVNSVNICSGGNGTLTLTGNINPPLNWESATDSTNGPWTPISNTTDILNFSGIIVPTFYRAVLGNSCGNVFSAIATVGIHNYWLGTVNTDWSTAGNWSDNQVPGILCSDVFIPSKPNQPVISSAVPAITNLNILSGAQLTINSGGTLTLGGVLNETVAGSVIAGNGTVNLNGTVAQTIPAGTFQNNALNDLIISNTNASGVTLGGPLDIYESVTYGAGGTTFVTNNNLTLKSMATGTAWLGNMTGHTITGDVTVERYIATGTTGAPNHGKSWQLLAIPTFGSQTIKAAWQEGATKTNVSTLGAVGPGNPVAGYGTMITSAVAGAATQPTPGFDAYTSPGPSMKIYDTLTTGYFGTASAQVPIYDQRGYFVFVRGDRSVYTSAGAATPTVLRTKGKLFTPANPPPVSTVIGFAGGGDFATVGNPYASSVDVRNITLSGGTQKFFTVWDPRLGGAYNYGAFQTLSYDSVTGHFYATPGGGSYGAGPVDYIQSGQAFFMQAFGSNGTVSFTESCKSNGSALFTTPNPLSQVQQTLRTGLYTVNSDGTTGNLLDGVLNSFDDTYSNAVDGLDARKSMNTGENLGIKTAGKLLSIERRHTITQQDTIFLNITSERNQPYCFHFDAENLDPAVQGYLVDNYAKTRTPLNMTGATDVDFTVANVTGSNAANRFMIFEPLKALPVTFTSIKAWMQDKDIDVQWRVDNEVNMKQYEVEKSTDGSTFTTIAQQKPTANNGGSALYVSADANPVTGFNYYRVKSIDINGKTSYTNVVKVAMGSIKQDISIYPNPITDGMIHLQFLNEPAGKYKIRLLNKLGQVILQRQVTRVDGNGTELIKWDYNLAHGMYQLEVTKPDGTVKDINVMY